MFKGKGDKAHYISDYTEQEKHQPDIYVRCCGFYLQML
jgi:hypothetical protein